MTIWTVYGYVPPKSRVTYDGRGSRAIIRDFTDKPSAERFALDIVETDKALYAEIERRE